MSGAPEGHMEEAWDCDFDRETAVEPTDNDRFGVQVSSSWNIGNNPNGGYLTAIALQALRHLGGHIDPISITSHYLRPGSGGLPGEVITELVRSGRSVTTGKATLVQGGRPRILVVASLGDLSNKSRCPGDITLAPPAGMPSPESCVERDGLEQGVNLPIASRVDLRIHPDTSTAGTSTQAETLGWIRFSDRREPDTLGLTLFADAFAPSIFTRLGRVGWVPTIELTVHVRRKPAPGWVLGRFVTEDLHDGRMIEDGWLWDSQGALVARSRQLAMLLPTADSAP
ncbi:MAG: thioesterase family protein [Acidimicrobiales bacterium]|nr:thioesterase family protein [Acidimicrobiales bacterium]